MKKLGRRQSALVAKSKQLESDLTSKKIPDQRYGSDYKAWDYLYVVGNLDRAVYDVTMTCAHEDTPSSKTETGSPGKK